jgi:hypothetical protein
VFRDCRYSHGSRRDRSLFLHLLTHDCDFSLFCFFTRSERAALLKRRILGALIVLACACPSRGMDAVRTAVADAGLELTGDRGTALARLLHVG